MKFKEFDRWCNQRACDGYWGMSEAMICCKVDRYILLKPFWKREKIWKEQYESEIVSKIVEPINKKIEKYMG